MKTKLLTALLTTSIALAACGGGSSTDNSKATGAAVPASSASDTAASSPAASSPSSSSSSSTPSSSTSTTPSNSTTASSSPSTTTSLSTPAKTASTTPAAPASSSSTKLFYGMNGHINQPAYQSLPVTSQLNYLKDLGVTVYRNDGAEGSVGASKIAATADQAAPMGIHMLAILTVSFADGLTEEQAYQRAYGQGQTSASVLKDHDVYYEAGNELEQYTKIGGDGSKPKDYDVAKFNTYRGQIRGMIDGIRSVDPKARIMVSQGVPLCYLALQMLWNGTGPDGSTGHPTVRWDITGYHWYESSGDIEHANAQDGTHPDVLQILKDSFGKPIWLTEFGASGSDNPTQQNAYVSNAYAEYYRDRAKYNIQNIMFFELMDGGDGTYGLMDNNQAKRPAYATLKNFISSHPDQ